LWLHSLKVAQLLRSAACLHTYQSRSYLNHLVFIYLPVCPPARPFCRPSVPPSIQPLNHPSVHPYMHNPNAVHLTMLSLFQSVKRWMLIQMSVELQNVEVVVANSDIVQATSWRKWEKPQKTQSREAVLRTRFKREARNSEGKNRNLIVWTKRKKTSYFEREKPPTATSEFTDAMILC